MLVDLLMETCLPELKEAILQDIGIGVLPIGAQIKVWYEVGQNKCYKHLFFFHNLLKSPSTLFKPPNNLFKPHTNHFKPPLTFSNLIPIIVYLPPTFFLYSF